MDSFTELEFNKAMAELEGYDSEFISTWPDGSLTYENDIVYYCLNYYNDLNQLMPLAWKNELDVVCNCGLMSGELKFNGWTCGDYDYGISNADPIQAIRECLWLIAKESKGEH